MYHNHRAGLYVQYCTYIKTIEITPAQFYFIKPLVRKSGTEYVQKVQNDGYLQMLRTNLSIRRKLKHIKILTLIRYFPNC